MSWLPLNEMVIGTGLLFDIAGVYFFSISGVLGDEPLQTYLHLKFCINRDELDERGSGLNDSFYSYEGGHAHVPRSPGDYDHAVTRSRNHSFGMWGLIVGFFLQFVGTVLL